MWSVLIKLIGNLMMRKVGFFLNQFRLISKTKNTIFRYLPFLSKKKRVALLEKLNKQKEILLAGSFEDKAKEFFSDTLIVKFLDYFDKNFDPKDSMTKRLSTYDLATRNQMFNKVRFIRKFWREVLKLKYQKEFKNLRELEKERRKQFRDELFALRFNRRVDEAIQRKTQKKWAKFWLNSVKSDLKRNKKFSNLIARELEEKKQKEYKLMIKELKREARAAHNFFVYFASKENNIDLTDHKGKIDTIEDFLSTLNEDEKEIFTSELKNTQNIEIIFKSTWIKFGIFIPQFNLRSYSHQLTDKVRQEALNSNTRGLMKIQVKKPSKTNPDGVYMWWNVRYADWKRIIAKKTGKNFWKQWYAKNRKNMSHLLPQSKYFRKVRRYKPRKKRRKQKIIKKEEMNQTIEKKVKPKRKRRRK